MKVFTLRQPEIGKAVPLLLSARAQHGQLEGEAWAENMLRDFLARNAGHWLLAEREGEVVGQLVLVWGYSTSRAAPVAHLQDVYVREDARRSKVAAALLSRAEEIARQYRACRLELLTDAENVPARALYVSAGFQELPHKLTCMKLLP